MRRSFLVAMAAVMLIVGVAGQAHAVSQAGAISLTIPIGARWNSLGESGVAACTDITAMWWNVGGFAFFADSGDRHGLHFMNSKLVPDLADDVSINYLGYGQYIKGWGMLGLGVTYLNNGSQTQTDESGNEQGTFNSYEFSIALNYGAKLTRKLGLGVGVKYFRNELAPDTATQDRGEGTGSSWAVDLGLRYKFVQSFWGGITLVNLGPDITFIDKDQSDPMPLDLKVGLGWVPYQSDVMGFMIVGDYLERLVTDDETRIIGGGLEWNYLQSLFVRVGYKYDDAGEIKGATWGLGVDLKQWTGQALIFDYANVPQATELDTVNRISLAFHW